MQNSSRFVGLESIKRSTWLATKISFLVLMPICALGWFAVGGLVIYKSCQLGISPVVIVNSPTFAKIADGLFALVALVVFGVTCCAVVGAIIGALAAGFQNLSLRKAQR
jgi:hypothetical protein